MTWRQFRPQAVTAAAALLVLAATLAITRPGMLSRYSDAGLPGCHADCAAAAGTFINSVSGAGFGIMFHAGVVIMYLVPGLIGLFWGAPLIARELESGTFRLAWNQSVTRQQWAALKLALVGCAAMLTAGLISLLLGWWASPLYHAAAATASNSLSISRMSPQLFGATGIVPLSYAAFAFALGSTIGVLLRRTLPAMAVTLVLFAAVQVLVPILVRPHLIPPLQSARAIASVQIGGIATTSNDQLMELQVTGINGRPGAWVTSSAAVYPDGRTVTTLPPGCVSLRTQFLPCLARHGVKIAVSYQPAGRYWELQSAEMAMYLVAAGAGSAFCYWRIRRPLAAA